MNERMNVCSPARQRGFTLVEVLVASAVFTVVIIAALLVYDRSNKVFKLSAESVDLQQNTRVAFDKLVADVRMAGFDYDRDGIPTGSVARTWTVNTNYNPGDIVLPTSPNGHQYVCVQGGLSGTSEPSWPASLNGSVTETLPGTARWQENSGINVYQQPDEQIEYAGQTAITIRANYDFDAKEASDTFNGREPSYENARFPVVTTGNDEIVTYALVSDSGPNNDTITFYADMNNTGSAPSRSAYPGGNAERRVDISGVDLSNTHPPYTLYRFTFDDQANVVRTPVASNIRSLRFKYYEDTTGDTPLKDLQTTPADVSNGIGGNGPFDPAQPDQVVTDRLIRAKIRSIQVELFGMNPNADNNYVDNLPPWNATTTSDQDTVSLHTRKVKLSTLVVPRNFGKRGLREQSTTEPGAPRVGDICTGYCGAVKLTWDAPSTGGVTSYAIAWDSPIGGSCTDDHIQFVNTMQVGPVTSGIVYGLTPDQPYCFKVMAINDYGASASQATGPFTPLNRTTPGTPGNGTVNITGATVATQLANKIQLTWQAATAYASSNQLSCTASGSQTAPIASGETITYNVWRSTTSTVDTAAAPYMSYTGNGSSVSVNNATGLVTYTDTGVAPCMDYYYKVQAVKQLCEVNAAYSVSPAVAHSAIVPSSPVKGSASSGGNGPAAPSDLVIASTSSCTAGSCTVELDWPKVIADTAGNALVVDKYEISRTQKLNGTATTSGSSPTSTIGTNTWSGTQTLTSQNWAGTVGATATYTDTVAEADAAANTSYTYEYKVRAVACSVPGAYGPTRTFPCPFAGGTATVSVNNSFQGSGTIADPYLVNTPLTITATTTSNVQSAHGILYAYSGGVYTQVRDLGTNSGPLSNTSFAAGTLTVGTTYEAEVTFTDNGGCTRRGRVYFLDQGVSCCLQNQGIASSVVSFSAGSTNFVDLFLRSVCGNALTIQSNGIVINYSQTGLTGSPTPKIDAVEYPTTATSGSGVAACSFDSTQKCFTYNFSGNTSDSNNPFTVPVATAAKDVPANSTTYRIRVKFTQNLSKMPITGVSIAYRRSGIDLANQSCDIVP